ncbi:hypothetical protein [Anaerotignum neopropionicum]|uniref:hypothetical protein n=1 Tax=Anaerotignum neopropionicum TaxID=36847 RepID=UPI0012FDA52B|nr:hypothetical protein [Anaerotignum neopropionicum]
MVETLERRQSQNLEGFALKHPQGFGSALCAAKLSYGQMALLCHCNLDPLETA